ncbi:MAG: methyltransferase domain-containing protein, partial [Candidatus Dormibacteria bacterium]
MSSDSDAKLREAVRSTYAQVATRVGRRPPDVDRPQAQEPGCGPSPHTEQAGGCCSVAASDGPAGGCGEGSGASFYSDDEWATLPAQALAASLGCGNPLAVADLHPGERVLDLGSGGGIDVLLSAHRVGPQGFVFGVDMTDEMLALARANADRAGLSNVEFIKGSIESIPLPDASIQVVISNCVINLALDKPAVLKEMFRVLTPGGRVGISDVVAEDDLSPADRAQRG